MPMVVLVSTYPDVDTARKTARQVVDARLAACVNMVRASSIYRWESSVREEDEIVAVFKTSEACAARLKDAILAGHPYDVPELVELDARSSDAYMSWIEDSVIAGQSEGSQ